MIFRGKIPKTLVSMTKKIISKHIKKILMR